jgi:hypothetical protein
LNETWLLIERIYLKRPTGRDYAALLDPEGLDALEKLKSQFGASNVLNRIRNNYAFHFPKIEDVEAAFDAACNDASLDDHWNLYFSHYGFNSFYFLSDLIIIHGIREGVGSDDLAQAQERLMHEVVTAVHHIFEFSKAFTAAAWRRHFGEEMQAKDRVRIEGAPKIGDVWIPFFVEMDRDSLKA